MSLVPSRRLRGAVALAAAGAIAAAGVVVPALADDGRPARGAHADRPVYLDPRAPIDRRVQDLLGRMTLAEKAGQMAQINVTKLQGDPDNDWDRGPLNPEIMKVVLDESKVGSILSGGGASPETNSPRAWAEMTNEVQRYALEHQRLKIPIIYGVDAVHGHNNVLGATMFPHQIGLGAAFDPGLVERLGERTGAAVRATGIHWNFAPVVDTARDLRWGRYYEPFGEDPLAGGVLGAASIRGQQGRDLSRPDAVAATAKHFVGYSAPDSGNDRDDATISDEEMREIHLPPFAKAIDAGAETVMINSGSVNGVPVHASHHLLTTVLRDQLGFEGVTVSDWQDVEYLVTKYKVADDYQEAVELAVNAGMDMAMVPLDAPGFTSAVVRNVQEGKISQARVDEAVGRILRLKFKLGLFERPYVDPRQAERVLASPKDRHLAREAAQKSLVLLENDGTLPLSPKTGRVLVTGPSSDSAVNQLGGWSIGWQGANVPGEVPDVTTIREGVEQVAKGRVRWTPGVPEGDAADDPEQVAAAREAAVREARRSDVVIVAVGEPPYAEGEGDTDTAALAPEQAALVDALQDTGTPVVVVVVAGRPLIMNRQLDRAEASVMAFLPGTEGGAAVADVLFGKAAPSGRLPVSWPESIDQAPISYDQAPPYDPRYAFGHGLTYDRFDVRDLKAPERVAPTARVPVSAELRGGGGKGAEHTVLAFARRADGTRRLVAFDRVRIHGKGRTRADLSFPASLLGPGTYRLQVEGRSRTLTIG
jgi:beta-glucosidase